MRHFLHRFLTECCQLRCWGTIVIAVVLMSACSTTKFVPDNQYLLKGTVVQSDNENLDAARLKQYVRQKGNSRWFSVLKIPLGIYSMAGQDTTKWINRTLKKIGEPPVIYDSVMAVSTSNDLLRAMQNMGYLNAWVDHRVDAKGKAAKAVYTLHPGAQYVIRHMNHDIQDDSIARILAANDSLAFGLRDGSPFSVDALEKERSKITNLLLNNGYYRFHKEYIRFEADTMRGSRLVDVTLHLLNYRDNRMHPKYVVRNVSYSCVDSNMVHIRKSVLENSTAIQPGALYKASDVQRTYHNYSRLHPIRFTNIRFNEVPDSGFLDCTLQYGVNRVRTISVQPEGTNTAGDLGAAATLTYLNRNIFRGAELFSVQLRGAFEAITGLEGYQNEDYMEYGAETKITFPRLVAPFLSSEVKRYINATSEYSLSFNMQNRPEFHRRVFSTGWRYRWGIPKGKWSYKWDFLDMNYIYMPWISPTFKHEYLDSVSNRNVILRYNYEDLFIMRTGFGLTYNNGVNAVKANVELGGNLLKAVAAIFDFKKNDQQQSTLFNIAFAQYAKGDFDFTRALNFDEHNSLVMHAALGIAYPYGNSKVLPFEKRYFSGGANSVRGWSVRGLGPGKFRGHNGAIDFINQTGDMRLDLNLEYRTHLFWKFNGALFLDGGNIWTLRDYEDQPGGQFKFNEFYKQIAVAYGMGVRLNFDYFILRFDMGMKAINPSYDSRKEHYAFLHHKFSRDFSFHFAVGMPF